MNWRSVMSSNAGEAIGRSVVYPSCSPTMQHRDSECAMNVNYSQGVGHCGLKQTLDVEDLGRYFEGDYDRSNERIRYTCGSEKRHSVANAGISGHAKIAGPSELRMWAEMRNGLGGSENDGFLSTNETKMATAGLEPRGENADFPRGSTKWNRPPSRTRFDQPVSWFELQPNLNPEIKTPFPEFNARSDNFCTEYQWLRCPATQCPMLLADGYEGFGRSGEPPTYPCLQDPFNESGFYYGENTSHLTLADCEYSQRYDEDSLSNEKRKEKSRDAARCRRSKETNIFTALANALPVPIEQAAHLDKASVMRLAIAYLKVRTVIDAIPDTSPTSETSVETDAAFLKALDGFMFVLSSDGDMIYLSENVSDYLGVSQMDMMGQNVYDYSHPCDHEELRECLSMKPSGVNDAKQMCNLFLRLKCTLTTKGRKVNLKSASYKVIHCTGHVVATPRDLSTPQNQLDENGDSVDSFEGAHVKIEKQEKESSSGCLVVVGCPIPHPSNIEVPLGRHTFLSKHSLNMKFTYADEKLAEYLGWDISELVGQSVFDFHHALDNPLLDKSFKSLFSKGQCETAAYRFLGKKGGYAWVVTQATLIHCAKQHKPLSVVCVNYILSEIECENEVYSTRQLEARSVDVAASSDCKQPLSPVAVAGCPAAITVPTTINPNNNNNNVEKSDAGCPGKLITGDLPIEHPRPFSVTAALFQHEEKPIDETPQVSENKPFDTEKDLFSKPVSATDQIFGVAKIPESQTDNNLQLPTLRQQRSPNVPLLPRPSENLFQGKRVLQYSAIKQQQQQQQQQQQPLRAKPQTVTRDLIVPIPQIQEPPSRVPPQTATASIFAPRTKDMNKGFLTFSEDQPGLTSEYNICALLKDEPEDLTHLAPTPGDVCVPLEDNTPFFPDMLVDQFILEDNYCPLLSPGLPNELGESLCKDSDLADPLRSSELGESLADSDPFMYRETPPSPGSGSPHLLSPALSKSPGSIDSLYSPSGSGGGLSEDEMLMLSIGDVLVDEDLALRAPYIPMSDQDEALQLFISDDMVMWGPSQPPDKKSKWSNVEGAETNVSSSLEQLLRTNSSNVKKSNDHGGGLVDPIGTFGNVYKKSIKEESNGWTASRAERNSHKRVYCNATSTSASFDNNDNCKRIKCEERTSSCANESSGFDGGRGAGSALTIRQGSQLLHQLMSQQSVVGSNARSESTNNGGRGTEGGGGGGGGRGGESEDSSSLSTTTASTTVFPPQLHRQQSNSVLMNLLVSGCDGLIDPRNITPLLERKISPLSLNLENHIVPRMPLSMALNHLSPDTRKELVSAVPRNKSCAALHEVVPMELDNFDFDVNSLSPELMHGPDLLKILTNNLA
ncbi:protein similar isoform X2 [Neodiprion fabricii]|uniref:protein similar isoform X2 n=1 Tax=Neodiprion fabricii TaxID=2872261 RepID=UPI001ED94ED4|nr:protein similar isoform X2 [Neodiprion fabricii]